MYCNHTWLANLIIVIYSVVQGWAHNHTVKWPFPSLPQNQEGCYLTKHNCHFQTSFLYLLWPELYIPAAWDMTWLACPCEQCCWYASEGRSEEGKTEQAKQKQYKHLTVCLLCFFLFSVKSESTKNIGNENWALLEEENSQPVAEDYALTSCWMIGVLSVGGWNFCFSEK